MPTCPHCNVTSEKLEINPTAYCISSGKAKDGSCKKTKLDGHQHLYCTWCGNEFVSQSQQPLLPLSSELETMLDESFKDNEDLYLALKDQ